MVLIVKGEVPAARSSDTSFDSEDKTTVNTYDHTYLVLDTDGSATEDQVKAAPGIAIGDPAPSNALATCRSITLSETDNGGGLSRNEVTFHYEDAVEDVDPVEQEWEYTGETRWETQTADAQNQSDAFVNSAGQVIPVEIARNDIVFTVTTRRTAGSFNRANFVRDFTNTVNDAAWQGAGIYEVLCSRIRISPDQDQRFWTLKYVFKWRPRPANIQTGSTGWQIDLLHTSTMSRSAAAGPFRYHFIAEDGSITYSKAAGVAMAELFIISGGGNDGLVSGNNGRDVIYRGPLNRYPHADFTNIFLPAIAAPP